MALKQELMASSLPAQAANKLGYDTAALTVAAAGSGQTSATLLTSNFSLVASGSGGVLIGAKDGVTVVINASGGNINVYPPSGCSINNLSANGAFTLTSAKQAIFVTAGLNIAAIMSA
jgi:hypothetical protein